MSENNKTDVGVNVGVGVGDDLSHNGVTDVDVEVDIKGGALTLSAVPEEEEEKEASSLAVVDEAARAELATTTTTTGARAGAVVKSEKVVLKQQKKKSLQDYSTKEYIFVVILGLTMSFIAGYSNGVCLSGYIAVHTRDIKESVAGVTGLYTNSAIALGENNIEEYSFNVATFLSVMVGACISSLLSPRPIAFHLSPRYGPTFLIGCCFSLAGGTAALHNERREFYLTAIANGIMNGISSMYTANLIRTTHLTGTTTDIGLFVGQFLRGNRINLWKLYILAGLATFFWLGSLVGYTVSKLIRNHSLILNAVFFFIMGCSIIIFFMCFSRHKLSFIEAILGDDSKCCDNLKFEKDDDTNTNDDSNNNETKTGELTLDDNRSSRSVRDDHGDDDDDDDSNENNKTMLMVTEQELMEILDKIVCTNSTDNNEGDEGDDGRGHGRFIVINQQQQNQFIESIRLKSNVHKLSSHNKSQQVLQQHQQGRRHSSHTTNGNDNNTNGRKNKISTARQSINMIQRASILEIEATGYHLKTN